MKLEQLYDERRDRLGALLLNEKAPDPIIHRKTSEIIIQDQEVVNKSALQS